MSLMQVFETGSDQVFFSRLYESIRRIFSTQKQQWSCEQIIRFLALIKVQTKLQTVFYQFKISGQLLFDVRYLWSQMLCYLQNKTYFPIMKLMYIISKLNFIQTRSTSHVKFTRSQSVNNQNDKKYIQNDKLSKVTHATTQSKSYRFFNKCQKSQSLQTLQIQKQYQKQITDLQQAEQGRDQVKINYIYAQGDILLGLDKQFKKLGQSVIADLSSNQLAKIFKSTQNQRAIQLSELIKKYSIDGYCIVCLLVDKQLLLQEIKSFFTPQELVDFQQLLNLILPFYYKQIYQNNQKINSNANNANNINGINFGYLSSKSQSKTLQQLPSNLKSSFGKSQMGTSQIYGESQAGSQQASIQYGTSQYDVGNSYVRKSQYGKSQYQYGNSVYGKSQSGNQDLSTSQYAFSERGSLAGSVAGSQMGQRMGQSIVFYDHDPVQKRKDVRISTVQQIGVIKRLKQVGLSLPFNLFKMNPLQNIKVTSLTYPFSLSFSKPKQHEDFVRNLMQNIQKLKQCSSNSGICSKDFNITGVKFGRSQQNDYRYPDELSISSKHAQIGFWDNKYQLIDLQSKTGTFLYIPLTRPLILKDQHIIQLSNEIEIIVHILKKEPTEGTIKLQFTKPQNQPFYKATLKQNQALKIGRSEKSHIKLCQQSISSKHTQIRYENQEFKLFDCLSSTGTWLRLSKKSVKSDMFPLQEGDIIRISSKKTYLIQKIRNCLEEDDDFEQMSALLENPNFKIIRQNSQDTFNKIVESTIKRKTPYEKKRQVHFQGDLNE